MAHKLGRKRHRKHSKIFIVDESTGVKMDITDVFEHGFAGKWEEYQKIVQTNPEAGMGFLRTQLEIAFFTIEDIL